MNQPTIAKVPKRKPNIVLVAIGGVVLLCLVCLVFAFIYAATPAGQAGATERAIERATEEASQLTPRPTTTAGPSDTPSPSSTPRPTPTAPPATATGLTPIVDVHQVVGRTLDEIEATYGEPLSVTDWEAGAFPSMPEGGQSREYAVTNPDEFDFLVDYDLDQVATGIQLNIGLSSLGYTRDDLREAFALIGLEVTTPPDSEEGLSLHWDNVDGYALSTRWSMDSDLLAYVNAYRLDLVQ